MIWWFWLVARVFMLHLIHRSAATRQSHVTTVVYESRMLAISYRVELDQRHSSTRIYRYTHEEILSSLMKISPLPLIIYAEDRFTWKYLGITCRLYLMYWISRAEDHDVLADQCLFPDGGFRKWPPAGLIRVFSCSFWHAEEKVTCNYWGW